MSKKSEKEIIEKMCTQLHNRGWGVISRFGRWNPKTKRWE